MKKILLSTVLCSSLMFGAYNDAGTDYADSITKSFTEESTLQPINTVNMILGILSQTKASEFVNKGPYVALIKEEEESGDVQSAGATGNSNVEKLTPMTIVVTRKSNTDPMIVKFWMDEDDGPSGEQRIMGHMVVDEAVSSEYPLGKFTMNFGGFSIDQDGTVDFDDSSKKDMGGIFTADKGAYVGQALVNFKNLMKENGNSLPEVLKLVINVNQIDTDGDNGTLLDGEKKGRGVAYSKGVQWGQTPTIKAYKLSLSDRYYKIQEVNKDDKSIDVGSIIVKDKQDLSHKVFRYGLYDDITGDQITLNSGFPIVKVDSTTGHEYHGYIGYWGLWAEDNKITNGNTVYKEDDNSRVNPYTVVQSSGKLKKFTKSSTTMDKLDNTKMYYWDNASSNQYIISWDSTAGAGNGNFKILGIQDNQTGEATAGALTGKYIFNTGGDDNSGVSFTIENWSGAWSESLKANIPIKSTLTNISSISFHQEEVVNPSSNLTLVNYGYEVINPGMTNLNDFMIQDNGSNGIIGKSYIYNATSMVLKDNSDNDILINSSINVSGTNREWGASVGPLLNPSEQSGTYNGANFWEVEQAENVFYRWETGNNDWNKFSGIKDSSGNLVSFSAPIMFNYEHDVSKDINGSTTNGGMYSLSYDGFSLQIPWENVSGEWFPKININSGTQLTDNDNTDYRVKILDEGLIVNTVGGDPEPSLVIPSSNDPFWADPTITHDANKIKALGQKPLNAKVEVIKGVCVETNCGN